MAYADFVTALMALFLVLWLVASFEPEIKSGVASYFRDPGVFDSVSGFLIEGQGKSLHPIVAPNYAKQRSAMAKKIGLGKKRPARKTRKKR